ncbi:Core-2/I-Branching enzyme [Oesophagostomum dentatum]|uniref:Core-2/I-Branching enzyme n=1 Tax=Oesophagostomum dentatum TaxID=61180 RepID=A0A0B1S5D3_OESDE|nr:Core-2/I-Branching enzyme [Oesophagostomum dentatum]
MSSKSRYKLAFIRIDTFREQVPVYYARAPEAVYIDCGRVMKGDKVYVEAVARNRPTFSNRITNFSCDEIRRRVLPPAAMMQLDYGIAYARIVYKDYVFVEEELRSSYHHQNRFCYTLDSKASADFRNKMRQLPSCLPNVYVASGNKIKQFVRLREFSVAGTVDMLQKNLI